MRSSSIGAPCLRNVLLVLSVACLSTALSVSKRDASLSRVSPKFAELTRDNLAEYIPGSWRAVSSGDPRPPEIEIQLLKGRVVDGGKLAVSTEYKYSSQDYKPSKMETLDQRSSGNKLDEDDVLSVGDKDATNKKTLKQSIAKIPQLGSRTIIDPPSVCPPGQMKDENGHCRVILEL